MSKMNEVTPLDRELLEWNMSELLGEMELAELHHEKRDEDFMRPASLRRLLRQMSYCLLGLYERLKDYDNDAA